MKFRGDRDEHETCFHLQAPTFSNTAPVVKIWLCKVPPTIAVLLPCQTQSVGLVSGFSPVIISKDPIQ